MCYIPLCELLHFLYLFKVPFLDALLSLTDLDYVEFVSIYKYIHFLKA